jgi:hypothetical protein
MNAMVRFSILTVQVLPHSATPLVPHSDLIAFWPSVL